MTTQIGQSDGVRMDKLYSKKITTESLKILLKIGWF
jgi:hypothetical protein